MYKTIRENEKELQQPPEIIHEPIKADNENKWQRPQLTSELEKYGCRKKSLNNKNKSTRKKKRTNEQEEEEDDEKRTKRSVGGEAKGSFCAGQNGSSQKSGIEAMK